MLKVNIVYSDLYCLQALDRRGQARVQLKKYKEALEDFEAAKKADPKIANVDKNIENVKQKMSEEEKSAAAAAAAAEEKKEEETKEEEKPNEEDGGKTQQEEKEDSKENEESKEEGFTKTDEDLLKDIEVDHYSFVSYFTFYSPHLASEHPGRACQEDGDEGRAALQQGAGGGEAGARAGEEEAHRGEVEV